MAKTMKEFRAFVGQQVEEDSDKGFSTTEIATRVIDDPDSGFDDISRELGVREVNKIIQVMVRSRILPTIIQRRQLTLPGLTSREYFVVPPDPSDDNGKSIVKKFQSMTIEEIGRVIATLAKQIGNDTAMLVDLRAKRLWLINEAKNKNLDVSATVSRILRL